MPVTYDYEIGGTAADGQTWETKGSVKVEGSHALYSGFDEAMRSSFEQLTGGKAVYGEPGKGCRGPYDVTKFNLKKRA